MSDALQPDQVKWWVDECWKVLWAARSALGYPQTDEVSIAYKNPKDRDAMLAGAQAVGINTMTVYDTVFYEYGGQHGAYGVEYTFLSGPPMEPDWRIELVYTTASPLHHWFFGESDDPRIVHASFKCKSSTDWFGTNKSLDGQGFTERMRCASSYGQFSYRRPMHPESWPLGAVYLKPRLSWQTVRARLPLP